MSGKVLLKFQYRGFDTDVLLEDIDIASLIYVVIDYWRNSEKEGTPIPRFPSFSYLYQMKHVQLLTDSDMVTMLNRLADHDCIHVWVGGMSKPSMLVEAALSLRKTMIELNPDLAPPNTQTTPRRSPRNITCQVPDLQPKTQTDSAPAKITPRRSARIKPAVLIDEPPPYSPPQINDMLPDLDEDGNLWDNIEITPVEENKGEERGTGMTRGRGRGRRAGRGTGDATRIVRRSPRTLNPINSSQPIINPTPEIQETPALLNSINLETGQSSKLVVSGSMMKKRVPKTTARRKGIFSSGVSLSNRNEGRRRRRTSAAVNLSDDLESQIGSDLGDALEDEESYSPSESDVDLDSSDEESLVDSDKEGCDGLNMMVQDNWDPYDEPVWEDDEDDSENYFAKLYRNGEVYQEQEFGRIELKVWQIFTDKQHLRDVVRDHCIQSGFSIVVEKASNRKYTVRCLDERCQWRLHASRLPDGVTWAIKTMNSSEHTCLGLETRNPMVSAKWAQKALLEDIRANNDIPAKALNDLLWQRYGVQMPISSLYKAKTKALIEIHGGHDISYSYLPGYCEMIKITNPGSEAGCAWKPPQDPEKPLAFTTIFISFRGALEGVFAGCRGLIGVDGTHLKGNYGGVLLSAIALDGNNELFPFTWGIVSVEDEESWKFFIHHLKKVLQDGGRGDNWCIISDRMKGIDNAVEAIWPGVGRRYCCKHLVANWKKQFKGPLMHSLFWKAAGAYSAFTFRKAMVANQKADPTARIWLADLGEQGRWTKHKFDPSLECDVNKTNFVESFNATLGIDRCRPVLTLLEGVRRVTMVRMAIRRQVCDSWERDDLCPSIIKKVQSLCSDSRTCRAFPSGRGEYEIADGKSTLPVSLNNHTCICNQWQLTGIPCKHGMRAILHAGLDPNHFVHEWYSVRRYKMAYDKGIKSIPDIEAWPEMDYPQIEPPVMKRGVGRPCRNRKRGTEEERKGKRSKTVKCTNCGHFGHNRVTCKGGPTTAQKKAAAVSKASTSKSKGKGKATDGAGSKSKSKKKT